MVDLVVTLRGLSAEDSDGIREMLRCWSIPDSNKSTEMLFNLFLYFKHNDVDCDFKIEAFSGVRSSNICHIRKH